jgi:glycosyltransferase involved in cell wall biosynthesis
MKSRLSIIIPAYNEEKSIGMVLAELYSVDYGIPYEVILVNDGSTDNTNKVILDFISSKAIKNLRLIELQKNMGKTTAVKVGIKKSKYEIIIIQDADGEYLPNDIPELLEPILAGETSVVYGSRFKGNIDSMKLTHHLGNLLLTWATRIMFRINISDMETGYKVLRREVLDNFNITTTGFLMEPEITAKVARLGYKIVERPITFRERTEGEKKISWRDGIWAFTTLIKLRFKPIQ